MDKMTDKGDWVLVPREPSKEMHTAHAVYGDTSDWWNAVLVAAPQPPAEAQADEVVCLECSQPTMHMGQVCYACSHSAAKPAEAQAQGGGEVCEVCDGGPGNDGPCLCGISAPPSAPVGVEAPTMAADVELLPLPEKSEIDRHLPTGVRVYGYTSDDMRTYTRACVAHATAAKDAEIEALRAEVERLQKIVRPKREEECLTLDHWRMRAFDLEANWSRCSRACANEQTKRIEAEARAERLAEALQIAFRHLDIGSLRVSHKKDLAAIVAALHPTAAQGNDDA